jgi:hypothetical protein
MTMPTKTKRMMDLTAKVETRKTADGRRFIEGLIPYNSRSENLGGFVEIVDPAAFNKTLADGAEVKAFWSHNDTEVLGSRKAGTLVLENRGEGLHFSIEMRDSVISEDRWAAVERGDVSGVSFGFIAEREEWDWDPEPCVRALKEVRLLEISPGVAFPAYPGAQSAAALRSLWAELGSDTIKGMKPEARKEPKPEADLAPASPAVPPAPPAMAPEERARAELDLIASEYGLKV